MIEIVHTPIDVAKVLESIADPSAGAIDLFIGATRNTAEGKRVLWLEYEAYLPMVLEQIQRLVQEATSHWNLCKVTIIHRVGKVGIGEASVVIGVSSSHRKEAFEGCRFLIDNLKKTVPIWKKEVFEQKEEWVHLHE